MADRGGSQIAAIQRRREARGLRPQRRVDPGKSPGSRAEARRLGKTLRERMSLIPTLVEQLLLPRLAELMARRRLEVGDSAQVLDGWSAEIETLIAGIRRAYYEQRTPDKLRRDIAGAHEQVDRQEARYLQTAVRRVLGVDVYQSEDWLRPRLDEAVAANVDLIVSIEEDQFSQIERQVKEVVRQGIRVEDLADRLYRTYQISAGRAELIARDQLAKWSGQIARERQTRLGIKSFIWRTSRDERVVGNPAGRYPEGTKGHQDHFHREGREYLWDLAADGSLVEIKNKKKVSTRYTDGLPGRAYQCRCTATPVIPEIEDLEAPSRAAELAPEQTAAADPRALIRSPLQGVGPLPVPPAGRRARSLPQGAWQETPLFRHRGRR